MQFRNRTLIILLSVLVSLSLNSCKTAPAISEASPTPTATPTSSPTATPTPEPTPTPSPTPYHEIYPITFGLSNSTSYQNEYFNVKIDLNERWFADSTAELDSSSGFPMQVPKDIRQKEYLDSLPKGGPIQEYYAHLHTGLQEVSILVSYTKGAMAAFDSVADYHEANIELLRGGLTDAGATLVRDDHTTTMFAGKKQSCWFFSYESGGYTTYSAQVILQQGDYSMNVYVSSIGADHTADILAMFVPVSK